MNVFSALQQQTIIPSVTNTGSSESQTAEEIAKEKAKQERIDFLNLLLTQLSNQNPLDPMDTDEFTAQLTRYSILEQGIETNEKLAVTNDYLKQNANAASFSYIGKLVEVQTNMNTITNDRAAWSYEIEGEDIAEVKLTVTTGDGTRVGEYDGSTSKGVNPFILDTSSSGLPSGQVLYLHINATDVDGNKLNSKSTAFITVDGIWSNEQENYLTAGEVSFKATDILKVIGDTTSQQSGSSSSGNNGGSNNNNNSNNNT